jgi:hypothetical protein
VERSTFQRPFLALALAFASGCSGPVAGPSPGTAAPAPGEARRPSATAPTGNDSAGRPDVSFDTERDERFARFLQDNSGGLIKKAAVGIEDKGQLRVEISRAVEPDDTLTLTKSLMAGARKDFPDRPITLSLYDPDGAPILKARYRPGEGVHYQIAHGGNDDPRREPENTPRPSSGVDPIERGGVTAKDRAFAAWAEEHGRGLLRYVEADLERHGRLWFGVSRDVKPAEVRPVTRALLEGARKEFPRGEIVATVFDPDGERIGKAHLGRDGDVRWEH